MAESSALHTMCTTASEGHVCCFCAFFLSLFVGLCRGPAPTHQSGGASAPTAEIIMWRSKKHNFTPFPEKYVGSHVFCAKTRLPRNESFTNMPSCINYIIDMPCNSVDMWTSVTFSSRKKLYHLTITASLLFLMVIKGCVQQGLGCAFFSSKLCLSCVKLCAIFVVIEVVFLQKNTTS